MHCLFRTRYFASVRAFALSKDFSLTERSRCKRHAILRAIKATGEGSLPPATSVALCCALAESGSNWPTTTRPGLRQGRLVKQPQGVRPS